MTEGQTKEQGRTGKPNREDYWISKIKVDQNTLTPQEVAKKYGAEIARHERLRFIDPFTGLWTLRGFQHRMGYEIARSKKDNTPTVVIMLDLDGFKEVNDKLGHDQGNKAIMVMANFLREQTQDTGIIGRYGGDEFAMVCPNTNIEAGKNMAEKIRFNLKFRMKKNGFSVTSSVGLTQLRQDNQNIPALLKEADEALKMAKKQGRNTVVIFDPKMTEKAA